MTGDPFHSWERVESLFYQSLELPAEERTAFLDEACEGDEAVQREVESLLASAGQTLEFLDAPLRHVANQIARGHLGPGTRIAAYELIRVLGEGGMGAVYLAERADKQYEKQVAIKLVQSALANIAAVLLRLRAERQILANLDHPNIAKLLDGGITEDGLPYLVMEYVDGVPIHQYCEQHRLTVEQRLRLMLQVCDAVEYAHGNLVIHRDLKPANILVTRSGVPKLLDFGIAKLLDPTNGPGQLTQTADRMMTLEYASPEQVRGERTTTATDVYALGIVLYELLCGVRPFELNPASPMETFKIICEREPERPSTRATSPASPPDAGRKLDGELDKITLMATRKEPGRRYSSVRSLSDDISAHLKGFPVQARTTSWSYRSLKFVRRHTAAVTVAALLVLCLVGFSIAMGLLARRAHREQLIAERESNFLASIFRASSPDEARGKQVSARDLLDTGAARVDRELADSPEVQAAMLLAIGRSYMDLGVYDRAEPILRRSYQQRVQMLGDDNLETANSLDVVGELLRLEFKNGEAEGVFRRVLAVRERKLPPNDPVIADVLASLGETLFLQNKYAEAEPVLRRGLAIDRKMEPASRDEDSNTRNYLALLVETKGGYGEARSLLREAVEIDKRAQGADSRAYARSLHNLAGAYIDMGDLTSAEETDRQALDLWRKVTADHPDLVYPLNNIAFILLEEGKWNQVEPFLSESLAITEKNNKVNATAYGTALNHRARMLEEKGDFAGADTWYQLAMKEMVTQTGAESWRTAKVLSYLGEMSLDAKNYAAAESYTERALAIQRKLGGDEHPLTADTLIDLAEVQIGEGNPAKAEPLLRQAVAIRKKKLSAGHPATLAAQVRLGEALVRLNKAGEAEPLLRQTLAATGQLGFQLLPWQMAEMEHALGVALEQLGQTAEANLLLKKSKKPLKEHPRAFFRGA